MKGDTIRMLQTLVNSAEPIPTPESGCGYSTLLRDIKLDSFEFVIREAIKALEENS